MTRMIDVSGWQHPDGEPIDWDKVKAAGVGAVMIKCSEGTDYVSEWLERDAQEAHEAGLLVGYYHFAQPGESNGRVQARAASGAVAKLPCDLGIADDLEVTGDLSWSELASWARDFYVSMRQIDRHSPLYTDASYLAQMTGTPWGIPLWLAQWGSIPRRKLWAWQTGSGSVDGIEGPVDLDVLYG